VVSAKTGREVPLSLEAERALLGAILLRESILGELIQVLDPSDFYDPAHQDCYMTMCALWDDGRTIDTVTVANASTAAVTPQLLTGFLAETPAISAFKSYADVVIEHSRKRRLIMHLSELTDRAYGAERVDELLDTNPLDDRLLAPRQADIKNLYGLGEFMHRVAQRELDVRPWLIPHLMKPLWRIVVVAPEGFGKAVLMRFLAVHAAAGRDPWQPHYREAHRRVLYLDVENAESSIHHQFSIANKSTDFDIIGEADGYLHVWHEEGGMDLRQRRHRARFEAVLQKVRPEIVFAGPLYSCSSVSAARTWSRRRSSSPRSSTNCVSATASRSCWSTTPRRARTATASWSRSARPSSSAGPSSGSPWSRSDRLSRTMRTT